MQQGEDFRMQEIMKLAHEFLQNFCAGNQQNQALLHKHINLFLNPGVSRTDTFSDIHCLFFLNQLWCLIMVLSLSLRS